MIDVEEVASARFEAWQDDERDLMCPHLKEGHEGALVLIQGYLRCEHCADVATTLDCDSCGADISALDQVWEADADWQGFRVVLKLCEACGS